LWSEHNDKTLPGRASYFPKILIQRLHLRIVCNQFKRSSNSLCVDISIFLRTETRAKGRYAETEALCNALLAQINPTLPEHADYTDFLALLPLHQSLSSATEAILSSEQKNDLIAQLKDWKPASDYFSIQHIQSWCVRFA
jgi:hypothetical protein